MLLNIAHQHLMAGRRHAKECGERCAVGCDFLALETALNAPVDAHDTAADQRRRDRADALLRGEIPT